MELVYMEERYIDYLRQFDSRVMFNKNEKRPYVGVILTLDGIDFYAPLSSPKLKHEHMQKNPDVYMINDGKNGIIGLNNMIPILPEVISLVDIKPMDSDSLKDIQYKNLLNNQLRSISGDKTKIEKKAHQLMKIIKWNEHIKKRCCNFELLIEKMEDYKIVK